MFLKFVKMLNNPTGGSSLVGDNSADTSQPSATSTPKRRVQSRLLELERYVAANGQILMTIVLGAKKPISPHAICFSQEIGVCVRKTFFVRCLKWAGVGREYIEVVKTDLQLNPLHISRFFVFDFNDQTMNRFVEHKMFNTFKKFQDDCHRHFKKHDDPEENQILELHSQPTLEGTQPLSRMRYVRQCWVDDWATQKSTVELQLWAALDEAMLWIEQQTRNHDALASEVKQMQKFIEDMT
ncbi:CACTA en-spm transposon protein [Cucumis melo var. makuwa]|uniref:CACTA en-spm transposon protein n=1 Tax=Cucumis melo var. makuwa TaxID=1194695 RepID=A0A5D3BUU4_CUCMM|nr:CACTA en-spm transposon protein [Cucumis melo var. makuwa]TYK03463.1 CACTA en-spm transposon protein [Cucumis melo var. makuwa]